MKKIFFILFWICSFNNIINAQSIKDSPKVFVYTGNIIGSSKGTLNITLILITQQNECDSSDEYRCMYHYENNKNYIYLKSNYNNNNNFCLVEQPYTGSFIITKNKNTLNGFWFSPDGKNKYKVELKSIPTTKAEDTIYIDKWEKINYELNDC